MIKLFFFLFCQEVRRLMGKVRKKKKGSFACSKKVKGELSTEVPKVTLHISED